MPEPRPPDEASVQVQRMIDKRRVENVLGNLMMKRHVLQEVDHEHEHVKSQMIDFKK